MWFGFPFSQFRYSKNYVLKSTQHVDMILAACCLSFLFLGSSFTTVVSQDPTGPCLMHAHAGLLLLLTHASCLGKEGNGSVGEL
ncbi:hypothetical protein P167DRAFT_201474 [Morchella conica CCBAS932]|uniref:Uncharacterized protein n=1 Tax=Morchella conica CCBAS932 TaxID=1392247 RepID=A0A3N4L639_9PEZI|nr:hypothetical protein P167DRAFT_201474 [Morchella conica CCBAS932]